MKTVANLYEDFARIEVMGAAESKAVVEQHAPVGDVDALQVNGEPFAKTLTERKVKRSVRLEMITRDRGIAVGEAGGVIDVCRGIGMEWEIVARAEMQRVALIMIEQTEAIAKGEVGQPAVDVAKSEGELVRIG